MFIFLIFALIAGMALPTQISINAQLRSIVGSPMIASMISFLVGTLGLIIISLFGSGIRIKKEWFEAPWWVWTGGLIGAFYVVATVILIPRLGAAATVGYVLAGQVVAAIVIDNFGLLGVQMQTVSITRILGALLIIGGVVVVQKF